MRGGRRGAREEKSAWGFKIQAPTGAAGFNYIFFVPTKLCCLFRVYILDEPAILSATKREDSRKRPERYGRED